MSSCLLKSFNELTEKIKLDFANYDFNQVLRYVSQDYGSKLVLRWKLLSNLRKRSASNFEKLLGHQHSEPVNWILNDIHALELLLCSGYVQEHKWIEVIELLSAIVATDPSAKSGYKLRLAAALALTFSTPVKSLADQSLELDAIERYRSFVKWADAGKLFNNFKDLTTWQMRYVVGSWATDNELEWARENVPLEFKSPKLIGEATHAMIKYKETNEEGISVHDGARYYANKPVTLAVMLEVGAVCGGISKFGCAMSQAFGIPAIPIGQPGHCAFLWWKEGKWILSNDVSGLGKSVIHDWIQWTWDKNAEFVLLMEHSQQDFDKFVLSEKLRIAAKFCSNGITLKLLDAALALCVSNYLLWRDLAKNCDNCDVNKINKTWMLDAVGKLDYFNGTELLTKGSIVKVSDCHERGKNIVDGTESEWWTSKENGWVEIDLGGDCAITSLRIQWWGTSVSKNYMVYATQKHGAYEIVRTNDDEIQSPEGYNSWSTLYGWEMKTARVKIVLNNGSLDPWGFGRWFGIRQILVSGKRERKNKVLSRIKVVGMNKSQDSAQENANISNLEWLPKGLEAYVEIPLGQLCFLDKIELQWWGDFIRKELIVLGSVDGIQFNKFWAKAPIDTTEVNGWTCLKINTVLSDLRLEVKNSTQHKWLLKEFGLQNVMIHGEEISVKNLLIKKAKDELSAWPMVLDHVSSMLFEADFELLSSMAKCRTSDCHERAQNIIDGTQSEWWSENQDAWVEIELQSQSQIYGVKIQWWGTSVSRDLRVYIVNEEGKLSKVKTSADELKSPADYNDWSIFSGWNASTKIIRFELKDGSLDPWGMGKYFGIRQIIVTGFVV